MKNIETLFSLFATLLYWFFKNYPNWKAERSPSPSQETVAQPKRSRPIVSSQSKNQPSLPNAQPTPLSASAQQQPYMARCRKRLSKPTKNASTSRKNPLEEKLGRYHRLHQSIIIHEILTPKYI